jgi:hypothetical protein
MVDAAPSFPVLPPRSYERAVTWGDWRGDMLDTLCAEEDRSTALLLEQRGYTRTTTF